jgi:hypothetical protein
MAQVIQVTASNPKVPHHHWAHGFGMILKYLLITSAAFLFANWISAHLSVKVQGFVIVPLAFLFTLQEVMFFQTRAKIGDPLKSPAVGLRDLDLLLGRTTKMKRHLDRVWFAALPLKVIALVCGALLSNEGRPGSWFEGTRAEVAINLVISCSAWMALFIGCELTVRTFLLHAHVDGYMSQLEVAARKIVAAKEAVKMLEAAEVEDWRNDTSLSTYAREEPTSPPKQAAPKRFRSKR